jgi:hypothetical protein
MRSVSFAPEANTTVESNVAHDGSGIHGTAIMAGSPITSERKRSSPVNASTSMVSRAFVNWSNHGCCTTPAVSNGN